MPTQFDDAFEWWALHPAHPIGQRWCLNYNFEWDNRKAKSNLTKHGVSFQQGATVFHDQRMLVLYDKEHSTDEERWITVGLDYRGILLTVCHTYTQESEHTVRIRIFSARKSTTKETEQYQEV